MAWLGTYQFRRSITVDSTNINSDLTHYALPLKISTSSGLSAADVSSIFTEVGDSYKKIAITESDGVTELYVEVDNWSATDEVATLIVSRSDVTLSSAADTVLYIYYDFEQADNANVDTTGNRPEVWDDSYYHYRFGCGQTPGSGTVLESTGVHSEMALANGINMDVSNVVDTPTGRGYQLNGTDELLSSTSETASFHNMYGYDIMLRPDVPITSSTARQDIFHTKITTPYQTSILGIGSSYISNETWSIAHSTSPYYNTYITDNISADWHLLSIRWDGAKYVMFVDGIAKTTYQYAGGLPLMLLHKMRFGASPTIANHFAGRVDEIRCYASAQSEDEILTSYYALTDQLVTFGSEEEIDLDIPTDYEQAHINLLIKQYWDKPKALAEIRMKAGLWERVYNLMSSFISEFDIDSATGDRLDIIGKIVGLSRTVLLDTELSGFGFDDNPQALGFGSIFTPVSGLFYSIFGSTSIVTFDDDDYRFYLKAKIAVNSATALISSDEKTSIEDVIQYLFDGHASAYDNRNMTLSLQVDTTVDTNKVIIARSLGLLTTPLAVRYNAIIQAEDDYFSFADDLTGGGFGDVSVPATGGIFSTLII